MNIVLLKGRIPFQPVFFEAKEDKKAFATFSFAVNTGVKEGDYYKEYLFRCTASGMAAEIINKDWNNKKVYDIQAKLTIGKDYEKNGEIVKGQPELFVIGVHTFNTLDVTVLKAKIPNFENAIFFKPAEGDKKAFASVKLAISTGIKEGDYYKERIITAKAFGGTASFLEEYYTNGDFITVEGKYIDGEDYEKDGEMVKGQPVFIINSIHGFPQRKDDSNNNSNSSTGQASKKTLGTPGKKLSGTKLGGGLKKLSSLSRK